MFRLFAEQEDGDLRFVCEARTRARADAIAHLLSRHGPQIVLLRTFTDGASTVVATFQRGTEVLALGELSAGGLEPAVPQSMS
jgi:hypothetical protein